MDKTIPPKAVTISENYSTLMVKEIGLLKRNMHYRVVHVFFNITTYCTIQGRFMYSRMILMSLLPSQEVSVVSRGSGVTAFSRYTLMVSTSMPRRSHTLEMASLQEKKEHVI